ncbi:hypothetical protein [Ruminococcus sp. NK3A76]|uniref:hypothetical protein n=1 Tax=Ruminococcus sp. NK3A76 TaxID=877411 RepID=UPI000490A38D|nr:hypothetical protein [Ruminococcus sp. NK3A76]
MTEYFKRYRAFIAKALEDESTDLEELLKIHKTKIGFFQHERFIHLIVMCLFAIVTCGTIICIAVTHELTLIPLAVLLLALLIPYIKHYYFLENQTQALYKDYDRIVERLSSFDEIN